MHCKKAEDFTCKIPGIWGWSGDAIVLGELPVPGRPIGLD